MQKKNSIEILYIRTKEDKESHIGNSNESIESPNPISSERGGICLECILLPKVLFKRFLNLWSKNNEILSNLYRAV